MRDVRSVLAGGSDSSADVVQQFQGEAYAAFPAKFWWFASKGYFPHAWQVVFHGAPSAQGTLVRNRHLVAGRRGGKTLSAAWEVLFYALHPAEFHRDAHGVASNRPLWIWVLTKDYPLGFPAQQTLLDVMQQAGLRKGKDFHYNKTERRIEFLESGTLLQFKTADDPQSLRGAGLDILWMDEAAHIPNDDAWNVVAPSLTDREGLVITTTTPYGKNWLYTEFFSGAALEDPHEFRVQYTSIDSPYFKRSEWERYRRRYHPIFFKQEFLASFEAMHGVSLQGDWLHYFTAGKGDPERDLQSISHLVREDGTYDMDIFLGIDPAISLSDRADHFAMAVIGVTKERTQAYLIDLFIGRIDFPTQLDYIQEWQLKWRPQLIGIESNAFQQALVQQASRLEGFPGIVPVLSKSKKNERILSMSPIFKVGKVRIRHSQREFIDQWVQFDPEKKNQDDDILDAVEIALGVAGVLLPTNPHLSLIEDYDEPPHIDGSDIGALVKAQIREQMEDHGPYDAVMGSEW